METGVSKFRTVLKEVKNVVSLPANRLFRALLIASTIAVVICYAWLSARLLEPSFTTPPFVNQTFVRTPRSHVFLFEEKAREYPREAERIKAELSGLYPLLHWLGPMRSISVLIDVKDDSRLLVTDTHIEMGREIVLARGQLSKAILKAWLLQHVSAEIASSQLRVEVASDVLLAMLKGSLALEAPVSGERLSFDETAKNWYSYADSYAGVCAGPWRSIELQPLCAKANDQTITSLSFRPFLGSRIWRSYLSLPLRERLDFIHRWVAVLETPRETSVPSLKEGWRAVVEGELETLLPGAMDPLANERSTWPAAVEAPLIVIDQKGDVKAPGTLRSMSLELPIRHARLAVMTACSPPSIDDVMSISIPVERVVWKPECDLRKSDFIQVRPSALKLALSRGLLSREEKLDDFVLKNEKSPWLGLADAKWDSRLNAYQVRGVIQAVELFRLGARDSESGATTSAAPVHHETL
jgi:hypothetical protein